MELQNLGKNILYLVCHKMKRVEECGPLDVGFIYDAFSDLPGDVVAGSLVSLVDRGLLRLVKNEKKVQITAEGLSEIHGFIPSRPQRTCKAPRGCRETSF
jgi:hypothetical protein